MTKPVLQTRCIGMKPHFSGHPLAPMEYVYVCEEPPRRSFWERLFALRPRPQQFVMMGVWAFLGFGVVRTAIYVFTGVDITG